MSKFSKDILFLLFEELQNDLKSLYSCLLVNTLWCETAVPILWRNPWCHENHFNSQKTNSLYCIVTFFLPNIFKDFLKSQGIQLPQVSHRSPLFDYLSFCRNINANAINNMISIDSSLTYQFLLQQEIYSLLMRKCLGLKYLDMRSIKHQIFYFPEARTCLYSLYELTCDVSIDPTYFYRLSSICQSIQGLVIINKETKANHGIVKLIEDQTNLKYFKWVDDFKEVHFTEAYYREIFLALESKADTLVHLITSFTIYDKYSTPLPIRFSKFYNLKKLTIDVTYLEFGFQLESSFFQNLEILQIDYIRIITIIHIIKNSRGRLRKILVNEFEYAKHFYEDSLDLIRAISENCPLVEYLSLVVSSSKEHFVEFEKLLRSCQKLKTLFIVNREKYRWLGEKFAYEKSLIKSASNNLREIIFGEHVLLNYGFKFSLEVLESRLENWRDRTALSTNKGFRCGFSKDLFENRVID